MTTWRQELWPTSSLARVDVAGLRDRAHDVQILDVRARSEWESGHIPGAVHIPDHDIDGIPDGFDPAQPVAVICSSGQRSAVAASLLRRRGAGTSSMSPTVVSAPGRATAGPSTSPRHPPQRVRARGHR